MKTAVYLLIASVLLLLFAIPVCCIQMYESHKAYGTLHIEEMQAENARIKAKIDLIYKKVQSHDERMDDVKNTVSRAESIITRAKKVRVEITAYTCDPKIFSNIVLPEIGLFSSLNKIVPHKNPPPIQNYYTIFLKKCQIILKFLKIA